MDLGSAIINRLANITCELGKPVKDYLSIMKLF